MICEMCGKETAEARRVRVEGSVLRVCEACSRFGLVLDAPVTPDGAGGAPTPPVLVSRLAQRTHRLAERDLFQDIPELELAPDWPKRIRQAREKLNWTPEELAKRLNEKKSLVLKMESGSFYPPDATLKKVEHLLKIRLRADLAGSG